MLVLSTLMSGNSVEFIETSRLLSASGVSVVSSDYDGNCLSTRVNSVLYAGPGDIRLTK